MAKKIRVDQLRIGMHVTDLDCGWMEHPFFVGSFKIKDEKALKKVQNTKIKIAYIDTGKGVDIAPKKKKPAAKVIRLGKVKAKVKAKVEAKVEAKEKFKKAILKPEKQVGGASEAPKAKAVYKQATSAIRSMMGDVRLGRQVNVEAMDPLAERMIQSVSRNQHAFSGLSRIKTKDEYTFMHCVSVAGLMVTFAKELSLDDEIIHQVAVGGLVHDVGKILVPNKVLNKPGKLTDEEFVVMKDHVTHSREVLEGNLGITEQARDVALLHHERIDGTGYPLGLKGDEISLIGKMSAIVDVYDALTSVRVYKDAWDPSLTLKKMLEWSSTHFDRPLVEKFIHCLGIYPVGSLVELASGQLAIVIDQGEQMLMPKVRVIYNLKKGRYVRVFDLDMAKQENDHIIASVEPTKYKIDISAFS